MMQISSAVVAQLRDHALASFPGECCGLLFALNGSDQATRGAPLENLADRYHALDPKEYPRTSRDAFMVNEARLARIVREAETAGERWIAFYHSHIECGAYFSSEDKRFAAPNAAPVYPELYQLVIETHADRIGEARAFRWDGADFAPQQTYPEFAGVKR